MELKIDPMNIIFSVTMVAASVILTYRWLTRLNNADSTIIFSAMILIGALAALLLNINQRLKRIEDEIEQKERAMRVNVQSVENSVDKKLNTIVNRVTETMDETSKRLYR